MRPAVRSVIVAALVALLGTPSEAAERQQAAERQPGAQRLPPTNLVPVRPRLRVRFLTYDEMMAERAREETRLRKAFGGREPSRSMEPPPTNAAALAARLQATIQAFIDAGATVEIIAPRR